MFLLAIASAERSIRIANAYFVPNTVAVEMLVAARRRGVDVEIIVPGPVNDAKLVGGRHGPSGARCSRRG